MSTNRLGILGGMGPLATAVFFERLITHTAADCDQEHLDMVILNHASLPDRTKTIQSGDSTAFIDSVLKDLRTFENLEVSLVAIPCNTSHYFYDQLSQLTSIPIINMVEETVKVCIDRFGKGKQVLILATDGTINFGIYQKTCENYGLKAEIPKPQDQQLVMKVIYDTKAGLAVDTKALERYIDRQRQLGCDGVVLACTELSVLEFETETLTYVVDALDVLVKQTILKCDKTFKA